MKFHHIAIAACALFAGQAHALNAAATLAAPTKLYITGSSALRSVIEGLLNQPGNCAPGTFTRFRGQAGTAAGTGDTTNGNSHNVYSCTLQAGSDFGTFTGDVTIIKREAGGSAQGVFPLAAPGATVPTTTVALMDLTSCTDAANLCTGTTPVVPDAGVSDLEPVAFNALVNQPTAFAGQTVAANSFRSSSAVAQQVFGLIVNDRLYNDLATIQGTATPTVSKAAFASIFAAGYDAATLGWSPFGKTLPLKTSQVNLCSRGIGSGTKATAQIFFLDLPYNVLAVPVQAATPGDGTQGGTTAGGLRVTEESSSGNVVTCVKAAEATGGYSIGLVSADTDLAGSPATAGAKFIALDGVAPGRTAAKEGLYQWVFESFYNVSKKVPNTSLTNFANAFGAAFRLPKNINAVSALAQNGLMALPQNCSGTTASDWVLPEEVAACSRVTRNRDSRQPLRVAK
jgi:hypothetical protein